MFAAPDKSIYRTNDNGTTWTSTVANSEMQSLKYNCLLYTGEVLLAGTFGYFKPNPPFNRGIYVSFDSGTSWSYGTPMGADAYSFGKNGNYILQGTKNSSMSRSTDNGKTWKSFSRPSGQNQYTIISVDTFFYAGTEKGIFRTSINDRDSNTSGNEWAFVGQPMPQGTVGALHYLGNGELLAGVSYADGVYRSTDYGARWVSYSNGITGIKSVNVHCFHAVGQYLFAGSDNGMYYSTNNGAKWQMMNDGLITPTDSTNGDTVWTLQAHNGYLFAGTNRGVFRTKLLAVGVGEPSAPSGISISPNPASDGFTVQCPDFATVTVRDVFGRIKSINDEATKGGKTISTADYVSGVYFVEVLSASGKRMVEKVIVNH